MTPKTVSMKETLELILELSNPTPRERANCLRNIQRLVRSTLETIGDDE